MTRFFSRTTLIVLFMLGVFLQGQTSTENVKSLDTDNEQRFVERMQEHLEAVSNKDLTTLKSTLSPEGDMQLILPNTEVLYSVEKFMEYHQAWFQDTTWTFETKILSTEIGEKVGIAITEIMYREPERNGKPYFNHMVVSYALKKIEGQWYIIKDHASSIEKAE